MEEKVGSTTTVIKYYTFNGMTIAMRRGSTLRYLHSDHLSSNTLVTNADGTTHSSQNYCAYGGKRTATWYGSECDPTAANPLPTNRTFTGQEQDGTGLMYYRARYFDPALGTFLSPDTMVPEPGRVADYNRFAYTRSNPLKFSDPSGHCATNDDGSRSQDDGECWDLADTIYAMWDADTWWQEQYGVSRDYFMSHLAGMDVLDTSWMQAQMDAWYYDFTWRTGLPHPDRPVELHKPVNREIHFPGEQILLTVVKDGVNCANNFPWGCAELADDAAVGVATGGVVACAYVTGGTCLAVVGGVSTLAGGTGAVITTRNAAVGEATLVDVTISWGTTVTGYRYGHRMEGFVGAGIGAFQRWYDSWSTPQ